MPPTAPRVNDPPAALDRRPRDGATYLLLPFHVFFAHRLAEGGGREEGWAATGLCPLTPAKEMGLPALHLPSLTLPSFLLHQSCC